MYSSTDAAPAPLSDPRHMIVHRMSMLHSAMPLFTNHLQLPLFTGQRRWHTMFGQLNQLTSRACAGSVAMNTDEDILADSNFASLFDSSSEQVNNEDACGLQAPYHNSHASCMTTEGCQNLEASPNLSVMDLVESNSPASDENVDDVEGHFVLDADVGQSSDNANYDSAAASIVDPQSSCVNQLAHSGCFNGEHSGRCVGSLSASSGSQSRTLHGRRHSDPGSICSSITGSLSASSNSDNWYYYDRRFGPGGELAAQYGRLRTRRSLSMIVFPPAYDDVVCNAPGSLAVVQRTTNPSSEQLPTVSESAADNMIELPPPYLESELPPSYSEVTDIADVNEQLDNDVSQASSTYDEHSQLNCSQHYRAGDDNVVMQACSNSHRMFVGRPAVRWNRNTRIERWTSSSFNWVMS